MKIPFGVGDETEADLRMRSARRIVFGLLVASFVAFSTFYVIFGKVQYDEGFYLYASKIVWQAKLPYRDFFFTQMPLLPYVYGLPQHLLGTSLYLGRVTSFVLAASSLMLIYATARRLETPVAGLIAAALFVFNLETIYMENIVLTTALSVFLVLLATFLLTTNTSWHAKALACSVILVVATGVRASAAPILLVFLLYFWWTKGWRVFLTGLVSAVAAGVLLVAPFYLMSRGAMFFDVFGSHLAKEPIVPLPKAVYVVWAIGQTTLLYFAQVALGLVLTAFFVVKQGARRFFGNLRDNSLYVLLGASAILVSLVHLIPTQSRYPTYEALVMPLVSIAVAGGVDRLYQGLRDGKAKRTLLVSVSILVLLIPLAQVGHMVDISGGKTPIAEIRSAAALIQRHSAPNDVLLTFDSYLAIEAQRPLPPGLEMSIFSYFPTWSTPKAEQYKVVNNQILLEMVENRRPRVIALTEFDKQRILHKELSTLYYFEAFQYRRPADQETSASGRRLLDALESHYRVVQEFPLYGQYSDTLHVYVRKDAR